MKPFALSASLSNVRAQVPLVHCITNYVTVNDCANALLACGASPIMSDEPDDVADISELCAALVLNIGTLNKRSIHSMWLAGARAAELRHPIVLDPVGAGASLLRTSTASELLDGLPVSVIRGNMSEMKALAGASASTRGVDVNPEDAVTEENIAACAAFACSFAARTNAIVAITGAVDLVANGNEAYAVRNGVPLMGKITGSGCMLTCLVAAYVAANPGAELEATLAAVAGMGLAGERAARRMAPHDGNGSFRTYVLDALYGMNAETLESGALIERVR